MIRSSSWHQESRNVASNASNEPVVQSATAYISEAKSQLAILGTLSDFVPVPLVAEFVKIGIAVLQASAEGTGVDDSVKDLQDRIFRLASVIIDLPVVDLSQELQGRIKDLAFIIRDSARSLTEISQQSKLKRLLFRNENKERVDELIRRLDDALNQFSLSQQFRIEELRDKIQSVRPTQNTQFDLQEKFQRARERKEQTPEALILLSILSLLPAGTSGSNLRWWAPNLISHSTAIEALREVELVELREVAGGLVESAGNSPFAASHLFVRPTIQAYMSDQNRIPVEVHQQVHEACYKFVLDHQSHPDEVNFKGDLVALASEQINIQAVLKRIEASSDLHPNALDALIAFGFFQLWTKPNYEIPSRALTLAADPQVAHFDTSARRVAEAHRCLGKTLFRLDLYAEACVRFEDARRCFKGLPGGPDLHRAGECAMDLIQTWRYMNHKSIGTPEIDSLVSELQTDLSHDSSNKYHVARGLLALGDSLWWSRGGDEALEKVSTALAIFKELKCPASTAECLYLMARTHARHNRDYTTAHTLANEALANAETSGDLHLICRVSSITAKYLIMIKDYNGAADIINKRVSWCKELGSTVGHARSLELLGYNCAAKKDCSGAKDAYGEAQALYRNKSNGERDEMFG
ncbi:hypothetical protein C8R45DRAFT_973274 [Mycena sanguinolenta]|nr:hypothetical protein C8R45DRAFT_973274 [Mycena sanguinolenta]